jgi:hypothetical protein
MPDAFDLHQISGGLEGVWTVLGAVVYYIFSSSRANPVQSLQRGLAGGVRVDSIDYGVNSAWVSGRLILEHDSRPA